ncbi:GGDEF domain-containing protein [Luteimonas weifangensis]|uniref:diguanylate cyclase n=1 Tax=Cognatiluteimonas weifangensis TaxID=2303539 RepID=A0A372DQB3_9GAMM|nr:GGDEF domain-containing protein [Luteimonas weifangensis]
MASPTPASASTAFDALLQRLEDGEIATLSPAQVQQRLDRLAQLLPRGDAARELHYLALRCGWGYDGNLHAQLAAAEDGLARAAAADDAAALARFHYCRAAVREQRGSPAQVMADYEAGMAAARRAEDRRLLADGLASRGGMHSLLGEQARAVLDLLAAQRLYASAGFRTDAESMLLDLAITYRRMGEQDQALDYLRQSEAFASQRGDWNLLIGSLLQQGYLAEDQNRTDDALNLYGRVLALGRKHASRYDIASAHLAMAWPRILRGEHRRALQLLDAAQAGFDTLGDRSNQGMIALRRGQAHAGLGEHAQALADYQRAAAALQHGDNPRYLAMLYRARARSLQALGRADAALADLERYIDTHERLAAAERSQQGQLLRYQFDSDRRDLENKRLASETALRERQLQALLQARRWQWAAMGLGGALLLLLGALIMRQLVRMQRLHEMASTDPLTGVANRRSIEQLGAAALARARALQQPLCVLVLDVDHFKQVNDRHGHLSGDQVLARITRACRDALRHFDLLGRTGGEEFLVLLPNTRRAQAQPIAERLRAAIAAIDLTDIAAGLTVTASIGLAELQPADADLRDLVARADAALYRAKGQGRDRVEADAVPA